MKKSKLIAIVNTAKRPLFPAGRLSNSVALTVTLLFCALNQPTLAAGFDSVKAARTDAPENTCYLILTGNLKINELKFRVEKNGIDSLISSENIVHEEANIQDAQTIVRLFEKPLGRAYSVWFRGNGSDKGEHTTVIITCNDKVLVKRKLSPTKSTRYSDFLMGMFDFGN